MTKQTRQLKIFLAIAVFVLIALYAVFNSRALILGPSIKIESPANGTTVNEPFIEIVGTAKNTNFISLNGRSIFIDQQGNFKEGTVLSKGNNVLIIKAQDRFGREIQKKLELVFREN